MDLVVLLMIAGGAVAVVLLALLVWVVVGRNRVFQADAAAERAWLTLVGTIADRGLVAEGLIESAAPSQAADAARSALERVAQAQGPHATAFAEAAVGPALHGLGGDAAALANLANAEDAIQSARRHYNHSIRERQRKAKSFPGSMFAKRLPERDFFEVEVAGAVAAPPRIQF